MKLSRRQSLKALAATAATPFTQPAAFAAAPAIRLVMLDVGGTIIQDRGDVPDALQGAFAKRGITVTAEEIAQWRGASKREVVRHFASERSAAKGSDLETLLTAIYADFNARVIEIYKDVPPIAGAETAFRKLIQSGFLLASSTGFGREVAASIFQRLGWEKYFAAMITSDDVTEGRPAIFQAMEAARVADVAEVIVAGDTPLDLQAGTNAGVRGVVGVLSGVSKEDRLRPEPHTDILPSVAELPALIASKY
jgi:phosphonatase-like hydrolase